MRAAALTHIGTRTFGFQNSASTAFVCLLMLAALTFSLKYFDSVGTIFHVLMLGFLAGMCGFCLTGDLFNLFV